MPRPLLLCLLPVLLLGCSGGDDSPGPGPSGPGTLVLITRPGSASVAVGGSSTQYSPGVFTGLSTGVHAVTVHLAGYADTTVSITVASGATTFDTLALRPLPGTPRTVETIWDGLFDGPGPIATGPGGALYLTAKVGGVNSLLIFSPTYSLLHQVPIGDVDGDPAVDIVVDSQGFAYVASDGAGGYVRVFDASGALVRTLGWRGLGLAFSRLLGLALGPMDTLHVATWNSSNLPVVDKYSSHSSGAAYAYSFSVVTGGALECDVDGNVYIASGAVSPKIDKHSISGALLASWPTPAWPSGIKRGPGGLLYVLSPWTDADAQELKAPARMRQINTGGSLVHEWAIENGSLAALHRHAIRPDGVMLVPKHNDQLMVRFTP